MNIAKGAPMPYLPTLLLLQTSIYTVLYGQGLVKYADAILSPIHGAK